MYSKYKIPVDNWDFMSGEGGIRTREPLRVTRFPSERAKPDYATSPYDTLSGRYYITAIPKELIFSKGNCDILDKVCEIYRNPAANKKKKAK